MELRVRQQRLKQELFLSYPDRKENARLGVEKALDATLPVTQADFDAAEFSEMII